jgi:hypothetical protein
MAEETKKEQKKSEEIKKPDRSINIFAFVRSVQDSAVSGTGKQYSVCVLALDGTILYEGMAMSEDEAKQISGMKDDRLDSIFNEHYPKDKGGWKIGWVNNTKDSKGCQEAFENLRKKAKVTKKKESEKADKKETPVLLEKEKLKEPTPGTESEKRPEPQVAEEIVYLELSVPQSHEKREELLERIMALLDERDAKEKERKASADVLKGELAEIEESITAVRVSLKGGNLSTVPCTVVRDENKRILMVTRNDTKEVVESHDWQPRLNINQETPKEPMVTPIWVDLKDRLIEVWTEDGWKPSEGLKIKVGDIFRLTDQEKKPIDFGSSYGFILKCTSEIKGDQLEGIKWQLETIDPTEKNQEPPTPTGI